MLQLSTVRRDRVFVCLITAQWNVWDKHTFKFSPVYIRPCGTCGGRNGTSVTASHSSCDTPDAPLNLLKNCEHVRCVCCNAWVCPNGMWRRVVARFVLDVAKDYGAFIFRNRQSFETSGTATYLTTLRHTVEQQIEQEGRRIAWNASRLSVQPFLRPERIARLWHRDCAYANGFHVLVEGLHVIVLRTSATNCNVSLFFGGGGRFWLEGFLVVVPGVDWSRAQGVCDLEGEGSLSWGLWTWGQCDFGRVVSFNYTLAFGVPLKKITEYPSPVMSQKTWVSSSTAVRTSNFSSPEITMGFRKVPVILVTLFAF